MNVEHSTYMLEY